MSNPTKAQNQWQNEEGNDFLALANKQGGILGGIDATGTPYGNLASPGTGVSSLNSETGAVVLAGGTGISVTPSGQNITIAATSSPGVLPAVIQSGLMADYPCNETSGTVLHDQSGNGYNGTLNATGALPTWTNPGVSLSFWGDQSISLPAALNSAQTIQVFCSFEPTNNYYFGNISVVSSTTVGHNFGLFLAQNNTSGTQAFTDQAFRVTLEGSTNGFAGGEGNHYLGCFSGTGVISALLNGGTADTIYINDTPIGWLQEGSSWQGAVTSGNFVLGYPGAVFAATTNSGAMYYYRVLFYNRVLTQAEITYNCRAMNPLMTQASAIPTVHGGIGSTSSQDMCIVNGDSLVTSIFGDVLWVQKLNLNGTWSQGNLGIIGSKNSDWLGFTSAKSSGMYAFNANLRPQAGRNAVMIWSGNDILNYNGATAFEYALALANKAKAAGWVVFVGTNTSRITSGFDAQRDIYNTSLRQYSQTPQCPYILIDIAAASPIGADGTASNTNFFYSDGIHLITNAMYNIVCPLTQREFNRYFGNNDFSSATTYLHGAPAATAITAASESTNTVTITSTLNPPVGSMVTIAGVTPSGYNGTYWVLTTSATNFTYYNVTTGLGAGTVFGTASIPLQVDADSAVNLGGSDVTPNFTMQSGIGHTGRTLKFKNVSASSTWTLTPFASETIDGAASITLAPGAHVILQNVLVSASAAGANWITV